MNEKQVGAYPLRTWRGAWSPKGYGTDATDPTRNAWLDVAFAKVRAGGRVIGMVLMIAIGVTTHGQRSGLGPALGTGW